MLYITIEDAKKQKFYEKYAQRTAESVRMDRGIQSEEDYEYQRTKIEYVRGSDQVDSGLIANLQTSPMGIISQGVGPTRDDYEPIDELVDEENHPDSSENNNLATSY